MNKPKYHLALIACCILLYVFFHKRFELLITETLIEHFVGFAESNLVNDVVLSFSSLLLLLWIVKRVRKQYVVHFNVMIISSLVTIFYSWYRFAASTWVFISFSSFQTIKYLDIIFIPGVFFIVLFFTRWRKEPAVSNGFIEDLPLEGNDLDLFKYEAYCKQIADKINQSTFRKSFAIGVIGEWGSGKTSFMFLIKKNLKHQIIFDFNPWSSQNSNGITIDFFNSLSIHLEQYHSNISKELLEYANTLISGVNNDIINSLKVFKKQPGLADQYELINAILKKVNRQIVVFIDDLDRLDEFETQEVIKLIRNTASFYNIVFVVAYDRNYLIRSIKKINQHNSEFFLEKIFQLEIPLPHVENKIIRRKLSEMLIASLGEEYKQEIDEVINETRFYDNHILNHYITTVRDINRLTNSLILNFSPIKGEVVFSEVFYLELLKLKFPSVYELLSRKQVEFFEAKQEGLTKYAFQLKNVNQITALESYIEKQFDQLSLSNVFIDQIITLVKTIFPSSPPYSNKKKHLSIRYPSNYNKYFALRLLEGNLSEIEFSKARKSTIEVFEIFISRSVNEGLGWNLRDRFEDIKSFDDKEDFEKVIKGIFYLAKQRQENSNGVNKYLGYPGEDLYDKLYNENNSLAIKFYDGSSEQLKEFVLLNFKTASYPFLAESIIVKELTNRTFLENFPLSIEELEALNIEFLKKYLDQETKFTSIVWWLYGNCQFKKWHFDHGSYTSEQYFIPKAKALVIKFAKEKDITGFLKSIINSDPRTDLLAIYEGTETLFDSWSAFYDFLNSFDEIEFPHVKEFKHFYVAFKEKNHSERVKFDLTYFKA